MGWIAIDRKIKDHWIWKDPIKFQWWIDLLLSVNYEDKDVMIGNKVIRCRRGECVRSLKGWADQWHVTRDTARNFLSLLERQGMIRHESLGSTTRIAVVNYDYYQNSDQNQTQNVDNQGLHRKSHTFYTDSTHLNGCESADSDEGLHTFYTDFTQTPTQHNNRNNKNNSTIKERESENEFSAGPLDSKKDVLREENGKDEESHVRRKKVQRKAAKVDKMVFDQVINAYHEKCPSLPTVQKLTQGRKIKIERRIQEIGSAEAMAEVFAKVEQSDFCKGDNDRGWKADFDWIMANDSNWQKIMSGRYDNRPKKSNKQEEVNDVWK